MVSVTTSLPQSAVMDERLIQQWCESLTAPIRKKDRKRLCEAAMFSLQADSQNHHFSGEAQLRHALSVAEILAGLSMDLDTLMSAVLLGVLRHPDITQEILKKRFGETVADMVDDLYRISKLTDLSASMSPEKEHEHAENLRRLLLGFANDVRVVLVVVAEQLHLMRIARELPDNLRLRVAEETRDIYAPLANRLGIWQIKWELEDLMLRFLQPDDYKRIAKLLGGRRSEREGFIQQVIDLLQEKFGEAGIRAEVTGRPKHIYSIWRKMQRKAVDIDQIFDLRAVRVLVDDVAQCYAALGVIHGLWRHIPGEFDDYIATPKANMYQSIHTAVIGPEDKTLEVQIRTYDMHHHSELGVAAHWRYKEKTKHDADFDRRILWMRHWLELREGAESSGSQQEDYAQNLEATRVYVLTPQGKVIELPRGATALDFAYAIHTDLGHRCKGARVDGHIVQLTRPLRSGETVEVLSSKEGTPSRDWLNPQLGYLRTSRARGRVKQWFKHLDFERHVDLGRSALEREMTRLSIDHRPDLEALAGRYNLKHAEDVYAAIGRGDLSPIQIANAFEKPAEEPQIEIKPRVRKSATSRGEVTIDGVDDLMTYVAGCCKPVPFDPVVGFITRGRGVGIHRQDCANIAALDEEERQRLVEVEWSQTQTESHYPVDIVIYANDRKGLLRDISSLLTNDELNVIGVNTASDRKLDRATMRFTVEVSDINQLSRILYRIEQLPDVIEVKRQL